MLLPEKRVNKKGTKTQQDAPRRNILYAKVTHPKRLFQYKHSCWIRTTYNVGVAKVANCKGKGSRLELRTRDYYADRGYLGTKAGGSLGAFDLIVMNTEEILLIQVKANRPPGPAERAEMLRFPAPPNTKKLIVVWKDYAREPIIKELT